MILNPWVALKFFRIVLFCKHLQRVKLAESNTVIKYTRIVVNRGGVLEDVFGLEDVLEDTF